MTSIKNLWEVSSIKAENDNVTYVFLRHVDGPTISQWNAGQYVTIQVCFDNAWSEAHSFTISNAPSTDVLQVTIKNVRAFTSRMQHIEVGTPVNVAGPFGTFCHEIHLRENLVKSKTTCPTTI